MKKIVLFILTVFVFSCGTTKTQEIFGNYKKIGKDYSYTLILNKDNTFSFSKKYFEVNSKCEGKWNNVTKDTISLMCNDEQYPAQITSGYMTERNPKIIVLSNSKIKVDNVILKKQ